MQIDKKEIKPITDILGLAILDSQRLENQIAFMMLLVNEDFDFEDKDHDEKIDNYMLNLSKKTLGGLMTQIKRILEVSEDFNSILEEALDARNYLMHRLLNDQGENFLTRDGRKATLTLVKEKREILFQCYFFLDPIVQRLMKLRGFPMEYFTEEISEKYERDE